MACGNSIQVFNLTGTFLRQWDSFGDEELRRPTGLAVLGGELYVCDTDNHRIVVFGFDGSPRRQWGALGRDQGQFSRPRDIATRGQELVVVELGNHRLQVFGTDGSYIRHWGRRGAEAGQFSGPRGVALSEGAVFVCDTHNHRIQRFQLQKNPRF